MLVSKKDIDFLCKFLGYGRKDAEIIFIGLEEAGGDENRLRVRLNLKGNNKEIIDCRNFHLNHLEGDKNKNYNLKELFTITLTDKVNVLEAVEVVDTMPTPELDVQAYNANLKAQLQNDIKNNPELYGKGNVTQANLMPTIQLIGGIFAKTKEDNPYATYEELKAALAKNSVLTTSFLTKDLGIVEDEHDMFLQYCEVHHVLKKLLTKEKQFYLLDRLYTLHIAFEQDKE